MFQEIRKVLAVAYLGCNYKEPLTHERWSKGFHEIYVGPRNDVSDNFDAILCTLVNTIIDVVGINVILAKVPDDWETTANEDHTKHSLAWCWLWEQLQNEGFDE